MKRNILALTLTLLSSFALAEETLDTEVKQLSYMLGMDVGASLKNIDLEIDLDAFTQAIADILAGRDTKLTREKATELKQVFIQQRQQQQQAKTQAAAQANLAQGNAFLERNKTQEGVTTTASGLQYEIIKESEGPTPTAADTVTVHYRGTLLDGTVFDSSYDRGQPATFALNRVITGWTEGLQLMPVGSTFKFFIPPQLAYGEHGAGAQIGPNATLIFEVELLEIK